MAHATAQLEELLRPTVEALGFDLWGVELLRTKDTILRIYIDKETGIDVDDCATVSEQISGVLDVEDPINTEYLLEVSSPGMDRLFFSAAQCANYVGEQLALRLRVAVAGGRKHRAKLVAVDGEKLTLEMQGNTFDVLFSEVDRANLVPQF